MMNNKQSTKEAVSGGFLLFNTAPALTDTPRAYEFVFHFIPVFVNGVITVHVPIYDLYSIIVFQHGVILYIIVNFADCKIDCTGNSQRSISSVLG